MEEKVSKQHYQLPNSMEESNLTPKDQLIYLAIKSFDGKGGCCPSLQKIAERAGASINTIRNSIERLKEKNYITTTKKGRGVEYHFNEYNKFEPFSPEFLKKEDISFTTKSYLVASQQYMFKDVEGIGKISYPNTELANKINMPESTIRKCNRELADKNYLTIVKNDSRDLETGCKTDTKIFNLRELDQAIIWILKNHEDRINENTDRIERLENAFKEQTKELESYKKLTKKLLEERNIEQPTFTI